MSSQFKVFLPYHTDDTGVSSTVPAKLEDGQRFQEVYVGPEFFIDRSVICDNGKTCVTIRKSEPHVIHLSDYTHEELNYLCRSNGLNPSYCELFHCRIGEHPYIPSANGLKLWKIQRHLYRYINDNIYKNIAGSVNTTSTMLDINTTPDAHNDMDNDQNTVNKVENTDGDNVEIMPEVDSLTLVDFLSEGSLYEVTELSPGDDDELEHYMKDLDISFASLDARGRLQEIAAQIHNNNVSFELRLRDGNGQVFHILD